MYWRNTGIERGGGLRFSHAGAQPADDPQADESAVVVQKPGLIERPDRHRRRVTSTRTPGSRL